MLAVAALFDTAQIPFLVIGIIPFLCIFSTIISSLITLFAFLTFTLWFLLSGVRFFSGNNIVKRLTYFGLPMFFELLPLPFLDFLTDGFPFITMSVWATTSLVRREDKEYNEKNMRSAEPVS